jgi:putative ABC transport system ATP-binding protein
VRSSPKDGPESFVVPLPNGEPDSLECPVTGASVTIEALRHGYRTPAGHLSVFEDVFVDVSAGAYVSLMGPSGSGKSTLLALLGGLDRPEQGLIRVGDAIVSELTGNALADYRRSTVGFVFQHFGLMDALTAVENVEVPLRLSGLPPPQRRRRAEAILDAVGMAGRAGHRPGQLAGGERQRVAIARALANEPSLLLADEPTGNLDRAAGEAVIGLLEETNRQRGCTVVVVSHNPALAERAATRLLVRDGSIVRIG